MAFANIYAGMKFDKGKIVKTKLFETGHLQFGSLYLEPGQSQATHTHEASDKVLFVTEGVVSVTVGGDTQELGPGAAALAAAGEPHGLENTGRARAVLLVVTAPPKQKA